MRNACVAVSIILNLLVGTLPAFAQEARINVATPLFDFGEILQGESLEHVFTFRNDGDQDLVISKVRSSCGCTAALLAADVVPPGGKGEVRVTFDSGKFRGQVEKSIYLTSNDPRQASTVLRLRGQVLPVIEAPSAIDLGTFRAGEALEVRVRLTNRSREAVTVTAVESTAPAVRIVRKATFLPPGKGGEIVLRAESAGREPIGGYLLIRTDHPRVAELRLPLSGTLVP